MRIFRGGLLKSSDAAGTYAPLASPALTGTPTAPTAAQGTNTTQVATTAFTRAEIAALVNSAPGTLDTLGEIATQLASDESTAAALATTVAGKLAIASNLSDLANASTARTNLGLGSAALRPAFTPTAKTTTYTAVDGDYVIGDATSGAFTVTLPSPTAGRVVAVRKVDSGSNAITVSAASGTIDGSATRSLSKQWQTQYYVADGTNWQRLVVPGVEGIAASGTASSSTYLRGDGSWATPSGGTALLGVTQYAPASKATYTTSSTSYVALDTTNLTVTFVAPASGQVLLRLGATGSNATGWQSWAVLTHGTSTLVGKAMFRNYSDAGQPFATQEQVIGGLTPGNTYTWDWAQATGNASFSVSTYAMGATSPTQASPAAPAVMEVWSA